MSVAVAALTVLAACSSSDSTSNGGSGGNSGDRIHGTVNVFTATSLTDAFDRIGMQFGHVPAGTTVRFTDGGSSTLATDILRVRGLTCSPRLTPSAWAR